MDQDKDKISILCFGNSLTAGFHHFGLEYHPYATKLKECLQAAFPSTTFTVDVEGLPGDLVVRPAGSFLSRMQVKCLKTRYDWVIVLGGTNDLGYGYAPSKIYPALQDTWKVPLDKGSKVLALTIPECAVVNKALDARRNEVNLCIRSHQADRFYVFDLHGKVPYHAATEEFREKIWDDGLHFTAEGYDLIGDMIGGHLVELLKEGI